MTELTADTKLEATAKTSNIEEVLRDLTDTGGLDGQTLRHFELSKIDLSGKVLTGMTLFDVHLDKCNFTNCTFNQVNFISSLIARANFSNATFIDCVFNNTDFVDCDWTAVHSNHMKFTDCAGKTLLDLAKSNSQVKTLDLINYDSSDNSIARLS